MKRYLAFLFAKYYPSGGMNDCVGQFDTIDEAKNALAKGDGLYASDEIYSLGHIFDTEAMQNVWQFENEDDSEAFPNDRDGVTELEVFRPEIGD